MLTLGINYSQMHDSAACIVRDGELLFAVAEERISRLKHDAGFPKNAIRACLDFAQVRAEQLDEVGFGWQTAGPVFSPRFKMLRHGENAADVSERAEFHAALSEHVAPGKRSQEIRATVRADERNQPAVLAANR